MSIRSSLLKLLAVLSLQTSIVPHSRRLLNLLQFTYGIFDLFRERLVIFASQMHRRAEGDSHAAWARHPPRRMQHAVEADDAHRDDGNVKARRNHADTRP